MAGSKGIEKPGKLWELFEMSVDVQPRAGN